MAVQQVKDFTRGYLKVASDTLTRQSEVTARPFQKRERHEQRQITTGSYNEEFTGITVFVWLAKEQEMRINVTEKPKNNISGTDF